MKKLIMLVAIMTMLVVSSGCLESVEPGHMTKLTEAVGEVKNASQELAVKIINAFRQASVIETDKLDKIEAKVKESFDKMDVFQEASVEAAKVWDARLMAGQNRLTAAIEAGLAANKLSTPINPYAPAIDAGLKIALAVSTLVAGGYGLKKKKEADVNGDRARIAADKAKELGIAVNEIVMGIEAFKSSTTNEGTKIALKEKLSAQSLTTKYAVTSAKLR